MTGFLRLELARSFRDPRYLVLAIAAPVGFYLLFAGIFTGRGTSEGQLPAQVEIMVAMATFGAMWGALSATAPRLARDRESGWLRALEVTPLTAGRVLAARIVAGGAVALPAIAAVAVTAVLAHHVRLDAWQWAACLGLLWAGTLPFVALGIAIGSLTSSTTAYALTTALYFALAALGGLWVPRRNSRQRCGASPRPCLPTTWPTSAGGWLAGQRRRFAAGSSWLAGLPGWPRSRWPPERRLAAAEATCSPARPQAKSSA